MRVELVLEAQSDVGESPVWDAEQGGLWWVDLLRGELHHWNSGGRWTKGAGIGQSLGFIVPWNGPGFVAGTRDGIGLLDVDGYFDLMTAVEPERPAFRMNDGKCDPWGRLWAGTLSDATHTDGRLYRMGKKWQADLIVEGLAVPNGLGWSRDGRLMYLADTGRRRLDLWRFDVERGLPVEILKTVWFSDSEGGPDGLAVDGEDCAWVCLWGGHSVRRYAPNGDLLEVVGIPAFNVASCAFGGDDWQDLYITTARFGLTARQLSAWPLSGSVFRMRPGVRGLPADAFRG